MGSLRDTTRYGVERSRHILVARKPMPEVSFDALARWATWVLGFIVGPMFIEVVIYLVIRYWIRPENLDADLTVFLTWCLVIGLAIAGFGQFLQALAHRWHSAAGQRCQTLGILIGLGGWATGLLAGVAFPTVDSGLSGWSDPTNVVFFIVIGLPMAIWVVVVLARISWTVWRELKQS